MTYLDFLKGKIRLAPESGFDQDPAELSPALKPHQRAAVLWALRGGRLVVQQHGRWETHLLPLAWKCSVCGFKNSFRSRKSTEYLNYCPCCGAKMDKGGKQ